MGAPYDIDDTIWLGAPYDIDTTVHLGASYDIGDIVSTDYFFSTKNCWNQWNKITFLFLDQNLISYINIVGFFLQILVLIFTDVCGESLREKNGDAHKGIQYVTIHIVTCPKYCDSYCDKNSVSLHS